MITPRYMICSEGKLVDREMGLVSHINVIDRLLISRGLHPPAQGVPMIRFFVSAVWAWGAEEPPTGETCDWEMLVAFPGESEPRTMASGQFQFTAPFHRFDILFQTMAGDASHGQVKLGTGAIRFTSRVRAAGATEWLSQDYAIPGEGGP